MWELPTITVTVTVTPLSRTQWQPQGTVAVTDTVVAVTYTVLLVVSDKSQREWQLQAMIDHLTNHYSICLCLLDGILALKSEAKIT